MAEANENLGVNVAIKDGFIARELVATVEDAGLLECRSLDSLNLIVGHVATSSQMEATLESVLAVPGVEAAEQSGHVKAAQKIESHRPRAGLRELHGLNLLHETGADPIFGSEY